MVDDQARLSAQDELKRIQAQLKLNSDFPDGVLRETQGWLSRPSVEDPALADLTALPFVTVDGAHSKDLDQALYIQRDADGYRIAYAIADASFYVRPGSALFAEALRRGASYYFPGFSVPMLPRQLSEGLISLNPDGPRRALVFWHRLDANGSLVDTRLQRAKIRSQAKLSFDEVQAFVDSPAGSPIQTRAYAASLLLLRDVGRLRMKLAAHRGLVRYRRDEVSIVLDGEGLAFTVVEALRDEVESWNEQLSLLCNAEGGRFLRESRDPLIQPIYRVQDGPEPARLASLARLTGHVARLNRLPARPWEWNPEISSLAEYLSGLPAGPAGSPSERLARALTRQAVMVNLRSAYSIEPGPHAGVGAEPYARFSAPMREIVGVFLHKEAIELLTGERSEPAAEDEKLQEKIVQVANRARQTQKQVRDLTFEAVLNRLFGPELSRDPPARTRFTGTVMGIAQAKLHVRLDSPPMDVKLYFPDLARNFSGGALEPGEEGAVLRVKGSTEPLLLLGQAITLAVRDYDSAKRHWCFRLWTTAGQDL